MTAVITLASIARLDHVSRQQRRLRLQTPQVHRVVVWLDHEPPPAGLDADVAVHVPPGPHGLRLAAGRNAGAAAARDAGHDLLVFLDADCIPGATLMDDYRSAAERRPEAVLCGPVTYLQEGVVVGDDVDLVPLTAPHAARPAPPPGTLLVAPRDDYALFWSLSFALTAQVWQCSGGFDPGYEGYGGEDTDFAFRARDLGIPLLWVGGAHAYHQYHPTSSPPWQHLDDILRNGARFAQRFGRWPMEGWLQAFAEAGAIRFDGVCWQRVPVGSG